MTYSIRDAKEFFLGGFISVIVFYAIRGGNPFFFNSQIGLLITVILFWIYYSGFSMQNKQLHFAINIVLAFAISAIMASIFGLITQAEIFSFKVFGSLVIVGTWISFPAGLIYDRYNIQNPMRRSFVRGK